MANLSSLDLPTSLQYSAKMLAYVRLLLVHIANANALGHQKVFHHIANYLLGQFEKCGAAALGLRMDTLASCTRNLFELSLVVDYVCAADHNMSRFIGDCAIDDLEIMKKFSDIDRSDPNYAQDQKSMEREARLRRKVDTLGLTGQRPLEAFQIAKAVNREPEYKELYKVYSKLTHASAWAILGGSDEALSWDALALLLLLKANGYAAAICLRLAKETGFPADATGAAGAT